MEKRDATELVGLLESLSESIQDAMAKTPAEVETELDRAGATVQQVISRAVPESEREAWLAELQGITSGARATKAGSSAGPERGSVGVTEKKCCCDDVRNGTKERDGEELPFVECIHGCGLRFCTATCRKKQLRGHCRACPAIAKKALLRRMGITSDAELF